MKIDGRCLFVWRHADAGEPADDAARDYLRELTRRGQDQADQAAAWIRASLPTSYTLLSSPAPRAWQTASALGHPEAFDVLRPDAPVATLHEALQPIWPGSDGPVVLVGHQPQLGGFISSLIAPMAAPLTIRKAGVWVFRLRADRQAPVSVLAVRDPGFASAALPA